MRGGLISASRRVEGADVLFERRLMCCSNGELGAAAHAAIWERLDDENDCHVITLPAAYADFLTCASMPR